MKVDLHCHTRATKNDGAGRNVTKKLFREKIELAGVRAVAITNHNDFDLAQYEELAGEVRDIAMVWPGVELDIERWDDLGKTSKPWHMIAVAGPNQRESFNAAIKELRGEKQPKYCSWKFETIWEKLRELDVLFISHCHQKEPAVTFDEIDRINQIAKEDSWRFYYEPRSFVTLGIWANHGYNMMIGSDVKDWSSYEHCKFATLRLEVDSFEQFYLLAQRDHQVVETLLNKKGVQQVTASPASGVNVSFPLYQDINIIFGQKGTGKSQIIKSLQKQFQDHGVSLSCYIGGQKYSEFESLLDVSDGERDCLDFERSDGLAELEFIKSWEDEHPTTLSGYVDWKSTAGNSENKDAFKISDGQALPEPSENTYTAPRDNAKYVEKFAQKISDEKIDECLSETDRSELTRVLETLTSNLYASSRSAYISLRSTVLANKSLTTIKALIDQKSNTKSMPNDTGFARFVHNRIELAKRVRDVLNLIAPKCISEPSYLGTLEDKGQLDLVLQKRYLCKESRKEEFSIPINKLKQFKKKLEGVRDSFIDPALPGKVTDFNAHASDSGISSLSSFIGLTKHVVIHGSNKVYEPSDGEKGILVIERKLKDDAEVYLLDEPELGMGNYYVDTVIRARLLDLAQRRKTVVVATHNANIAVRTLPYLSIYREHVSGDVYRTYVGSPFTNELCDIEGTANSLDWTETSMKTLEGGPEAFYNRLRIYEAGSK